MTKRWRSARPHLPLRVRGDPWLYAVARLLLVPAVVLYGRVRIHGAERVPARGAVLVVANHPSDVDPILVAIAVARPLRFMADAVQFERGFVGPVIRRLGAFPVHLDRPDVSAVRTAIRLLEAGEAVALFPEGDVLRSPEPGSFHRGVGLLAARTGAPVIPVAVVGAERLWAGGRLHWPRIGVRFGTPIRVSGACDGEAAPTCLTSAVRSAVTSLAAVGVTPPRPAPPPPRPGPQTPPAGRRRLPAPRPHPRRS